MSINYMIKMIEEFCFNYAEPFSIDHGRFKADFINYLQKQGCKVIEEYDLVFNNVTGKGEIVEKRGLIDFMVFYENKRFAVEFDNGNRLKLKSIAKLLQSGANGLIGIVRGNESYDVQFSNRRRIKWVKKKVQIFRRILLIIMTSKSYCWI